MADLSKYIQDCINYNPVALLNIDSKVLKERIDQVLPYSVGIEIECDSKKTFSDLSFECIDNILHVHCDITEKRFRIPNGLKGLICLQEITKELKNNCLINNGSGIHYHVDFTDAYSYLSSDFIDQNSDWILEELDIWEYKGTFNSRTCKFNTNHNWVRFQEFFKTMEIRIGEMTFDYSLLSKRIIHACQIAKKLKDNLGKTKEEFDIFRLSNQLESFDVEENKPIEDDFDPSLIIKNRQIKINGR